MPLTIRLILAAMLAGAAAWYGLDLYQTRHLTQLFTARFEQQLQGRAHEDRMRFDEQIRAHMALVRLLAEHRPAVQALERLRPAEGPAVRDGLPPWMPRRSVLRAYAPPDLVMVADAAHRIVELWNNTPAAPPPALLAGGPRLFLRAEAEPLLTSFDGAPHLVMAAPVRDGAGAVQAWLLTASALDGDFLLRGQGRHLGPDHVVALVGTGEAPRILASSDEHALPPGTDMAAAQRSHLLAGKSFFDYGNSELLASFAVLIPRSVVARATRETLSLEREHRTLMAGLMAVCFLLALAYLTLRLRRLAEAVGLFRARAFAVAATPARRGDELAALEQAFGNLADEVIASRAELDRRAREKTELLVERMRTRGEYDRLRTLHAVTDHLGVGVIRLEPDGPVPANETMARFIADCGPIGRFLEAPAGGDAVFPSRGGERVFALLCPAEDRGFVLVRDVTEERRAEQALKRMNETLEQQVFERTGALQEEVARHLETEAALTATKERAEIASRSKSEFLANVSHELRTPLNAILGFSEVMMGEVFGPLGNARYAAYARDIHFSGAHLLEVINDILDISKIEAGRMELNLEPASLADIAGAAVRLARERLDAAGVSLSVAVAPHLPQVRGDHRRLKQTIVNLLSNAAKFTPEGGTVTLLVDAACEEVRVTVADTGIGMTPQEIAVALEPFRQVDGGLARRYEGTGLGLPLARSFVEMHGGRFRIESCKGVGTTVTMALPALPQDAGGPEGPPAVQSVLSGVA